MSAKNSHTNRVPREGEGYTNDYLIGIITFVSAPITASNGKEYYRFEIEVQRITDPEHPSALTLKIGDRVFRQATPERRLDGTFNKLKNYGVK